MMQTKIAPQILTEYPRGWFVVGYSNDIKLGQILKRRLFGRELVLYRTLAGKAVLCDAHCPHLGAHLAYGGKIEGECIRCPFHGLCFDTEGKCVSTTKMKLNIWLLQEHGGFLFTYFDSNENPSPRWELPKLDDSCYTKIKGGCTLMRGHPQEVLENSVDFAHLSALHGFELSSVAPQVSEEGSVFKVVAAIERPGHLFTRKRILATYKTYLYGLGISYVDVEIPEQDFRLRLFGMITPVDPGVMELRLAVQLHKITKPRRIHPFFTLFPKRWIETFILHQAYRAYVSDVSKDFPIWENKIYLPLPGSLPSNGPLLRYRRWAEQFYQHKSINP